MLAIKITFNDGSVGRMFPAPANRLETESESEFFSRIATKDCPVGASWELIDDSQFPSDPVVSNIPNIISDRQFYQQLYVENFISAEEALAAVMVGTLPSPIVGFINNLTEEEQFNARMLLSGAKEFRRDHPLVEQVAGYLNLNSEWIDEFFKKAAAL